MQFDVALEKCGRNFKVCPETPQLTLIGSLNSCYAMDEHDHSEKSIGSDDEYFEEPPVINIHLPRNPRSKAKYNLFSRLLFL